ncbi:DUF2975 domain-containing protein [Microlunatus speluncae]|uniref:DUF2975 domain-containing protein n=1 Tax=Microlunatus speluncae TaxID=2594267 RepID=UPI00126639E2|nr:DUF2975 domain-containing protein [Microlunatus speluncae]
MSTGIWRWTRADDVGLRVVIMVGVLVLAVRALWPIGGWLTGAPLTWHGRVQAEAPAPTAVVDGATVSYLGQVRWEITGATAGQWLLAMVPDLLDLIAVAAAAIMLWQLLGQLRGGEPFSARAVRAVRGLSLVLAGWLVLRPFVVALADAGITTPLRRTGLEFVLRLEPLWLAGFAGVIGLIAVAEAFRVGAKLRADTVGLV